MNNSITQLLENILSAVYGEDVRQAIHDSILKCYEDAIKAGNANMEVSQARGIYSSLAERLAADLSSTIEKISVGDSRLKTLIDSVVSGSPLVASSVSGMTDTSRIYVNTTDGKWYYYNGSTWTIGGVYQSTGIAESSVNYADIDNVTAQICDIKNVLYTLNADHYIGANGNISSENTGYQYTSPIDLKQGEVIAIYTGGSANNVAIISEYEDGQTKYLPLVIADTADNKYYYYFAPRDMKVILSGKKAVWEKIRILNIGNKDLLKLLFNLNKVIDVNMITGYFVNYITGLVRENAGWKCSDYVKILPGATIKIISNINLAPNSTGVSGIAFYDKYKRFISGLQYPLVTEYDFTIPDNAYYMKYSKRAEARIFTIAYEDVLIPLYNLILNEREEIEKFFDFSLFTKVGVIGDSYASGAFPESPGASTAPAHYSMSWPTMLKRKYGFTLHNFSVNGQSTRSFINTTGKLNELLNTEKCDIYLLVLERNDYNIENNGETGYLGSITDITGHSLGNYPDTFYGNYATIIETILNYSPNSKLVMVTGDYLNALGTQYNNAVIEIAEHYNIPVIIENDDPFFDSPFYRNYYNANHPPAMKYNGMAVAMDRLLDKCIKEYDTYFAFTLPME